MVNENIQNKIKLKIKECFQKANKQFNAKAKLDDLTINKRLTRSWGRAIYTPDKGYVIELSMDGVVNDLEHVLTNVIPHEVAHIVAYWLSHHGLPNGDIGHGQGWKTIFIALGGNGNTLDKMLPNAGYHYKLRDGSTIQLGKKQHEYLQNYGVNFKTKTGEKVSAKDWIPPRK